jgi:riboflavin synthase
MFTGIITDIGTVRSAEARGDLRLTIACGYDMSTVDLGASIACSGTCLTVVDTGDDWFAVDVSAETQARTPADRWLEGTRLNLERPLRVGDELGGHIVTGHVDGIGEVVGICPEGGSTRVGIRAPAEIAPFLAPKGSIAVDGVSLTLNALRDIDGGGTDFSVNIIPHTTHHTTLGSLEVSKLVNLEIDVLARYLQRLDSVRQQNRKM